MILGTPVIAVTLFLLVLERGLHIGFFDPAYGGDPVLFQHLFWFYSHPAVYIMILPSMGVVTEIDHDLQFEEAFRLYVYRVFERRDRGVRIPRVGTSPVRQRPVGLCRNGVLHPELYRGDPLGDQGFQLDRDHV